MKKTIIIIILALLAGCSKKETTDPKQRLLWLDIPSTTDLDDQKISIKHSSDWTRIVSDKDASVYVSAGDSITITQFFSTNDPGIRVECSALPLPNGGNFTANVKLDTLTFHGYDSDVEDSTNKYLFVAQ